jgi:hypothetical protein
MTPIDRRRMDDGEAALRASQDLSTMTLPQLRELYGQLFDGATAMQSLDDLGVPRAERGRLAALSRAGA